MNHLEEKQLTDTAIHYWIGGEKTKDCILFLHSAFSAHHCFDEQLSFFSKNYRVIAIDLLGHGKSIKGQKGDGIEKMTSYIHEILAINSIAKVHLVGVSMGAIIAQDFANQYPEIVASLCCAGAYDINNFDAKMQKENSSSQAKLFIKSLISIKWFAKSNSLITAYTKEAQEKYYQMNIQFKKSSLRYMAGLNNLINKNKTIPRNYPLLIVCGQYDAPLALKASEAWHQNEPQSQYIILNEAGHHVNMDVPSKFNEVLSNHLIKAVE